VDDLQERVAVVTGAASGIGLAISRALADEGMHVVMADVDLDRLASAASEVSEGAPGRVIAVRTDVAKWEDVDALARRAAGELGAVHVLCGVRRWSFAMLIVPASLFTHTIGKRRVSTHARCEPSSSAHPDSE
jgi:hypothetical protein